ncbi:MAG: hypothetical protein WCK80_01700 [bacterium]
MAKSSRKTLLITLIIVVLFVGFVAALELTGRTSVILDRGPKRIIDTTTKTTSGAASAQSEFNSGGNREPAPAQSKPAISVNDTGGLEQPQSATAPLVSKDGTIKVTSPTSKGLFTSGSSLTGKASVPKVSYRLIDNVSGVTAAGELGVVNGNFSGKFSFSTKATQGRLDVFQTGAGGVENSIIEIPVRFR